MPISKNRLIVFFVPPEKIVNGGVMSIFSLCKESRRFERIHKSDVVICTYPGKPSYHTNNLFKNNEYVFSFAEIVEKYPQLNSIMLHVPELDLRAFYTGIQKFEGYIKDIPFRHINIMNQNIQYMPGEQAVASLYRFADKLTQTTAHDRYATQAVCDKYGMPLHHFSVFIDSAQYVAPAYKNKQNIIAYSRDQHPAKAEIIEKMQKRLKSYRLVEVNNMTYEEYKDLIAQAKYTLTFGEGFDGYLIEGIFSGSVAFAAYNEDFFPSNKFRNYQSIYADYGEMLKKICDDVIGLDNEGSFTRLNHEIKAQIEKLYNFKQYLKNLELYYSGHYSFTPRSGSEKEFFIRAVVQKDWAINSISKDIKQSRYAQRLAEQSTENERQRANHYRMLLEEIRSSKSWRVTRPLRKGANLAQSVKPSRSSKKHH